MGLSGMAPETEQDEVSGDEQNKTLIANLYDQPEGRYKDCSNWEHFSQRAYNLMRGGGLLRNWFQNTLVPNTSFSHREEWFGQFVLGLAKAAGIEEQDEDEEHRLDHVFRVLLIDEEEIASYLQAHPDEAEAVVEELDV